MDKHLNVWQKHYLDVYYDGKMPPQKVENESWSCSVR